MQTLIYHGKVDMIYCQIKYNKWRVKQVGNMGTPEWSSCHEHPECTDTHRTIRGLAEQILHIRGVRKHPHLNRQEMLRHTLALSPHIYPTQYPTPRFSLKRTGCGFCI